MSIDLIASNTHGNLDEQIAQLTQCKPLSEPELWCFQHHLMPLAEYQQLCHNLNEWMICIVPILKKVVDLLLELDKLLFSFEVCRRFMLGLLVLLPWCLLMAMVLSISLCSICFRSKWSI